MIRLRKPLLSALMFFCALFGPTAHAEPVSQIVASPAQQNLLENSALLRAIFTLRVRSWPDGTQVRVFVLPDDTELHKAFCREYLSTYPYVLRANWDQKVFTGVGLAPIVVRDEEEMRERIRQTPGAIGYLAYQSGDESRWQETTMLLTLNRTSF